MARGTHIEASEDDGHRSPCEDGMSAMAVLIPVGIAMGAVGLAVFFWSLRTGQYEDMDGAAERILGDDEDEP